MVVVASCVCIVVGQIMVRMGREGVGTCTEKTR